MLLLSIMTWIVLVYSFRVMVFGNPLVRWLQQTPLELLQRLDQSTSDESQFARIGPEDLALLRRFVFYQALELALFFLEVGLLLFFWYRGTLPALCITLLVKNIAVLGVGIVAVYSTEARPLFIHLRTLPRWLIVLDRLSQTISGAGFALLFLQVNGYLHLA